MPTSWPPSMYYRPDVLLWDLGWSPESNLDHLADLKDDHIPVAVQLSDETYAVDASTAGAHGLLLRKSDAAILAASCQSASCAGEAEGGPHGRQCRCMWWRRFYAASLVRRSPSD